MSALSEDRASALEMALEWLVDVMERDESIEEPTLRRDQVDGYLDVIAFATGLIGDEPEQVKRMYISRTFATCFAH